MFSNVPHMRTPEKVMYTTREAAEKLCVHMNTIRQYILTKKLRAVKRGDGRYLIHANNLRLFLGLEPDEPLEPLSMETFDVTNSPTDSADSSASAPDDGDAPGS